MLPTGWGEATINDLGVYLNGMAFKPSDWEDQGTGIIRIQNLTNPKKPLNRTRRNFDEKYLVRRGDILVSWSATLDVFFWDREDAVLNQHIFKAIPSSVVDKRFLFIALKKAIYEMMKSEHLHGSTMKHINRGPFLAHKVWLPPLAEQRRIVAKLDSLTARIARARAELERAKRLQKQWFSKFLDSEFSCDGELLRLGELAEDVRYGTAQKCDYNPTLTPVLRIPNIASGNIDTSDLKHSTFTEKEIKKLSLCSGDLLIVRSNGSIDLVGQSAVADTQVSGFLFAGYLIRIRLKNKEVTPYFVHYWLRSPQARSAINAAAKSTSGVNNINSEQLKNLQIKIPSLSKQRIIVSRVIKAFSHADRLETEAERALALLDRLESSLLAKAFRGELVPQDPDDEPASVLLDRIQAERAAAPKPKRGRKQSTQDMPVPRKRQTEKHG